MKITYGITKETYALGGAARTWYGVAAYAEADKDGTASVVAGFHDVTEDRKCLAELVALCNRLELDPIHLADVVNDFLAREAME